ncbi:MAG: FecR domain-containing protein, partial [Bacteroidota bacterium]
EARSISLLQRRKWWSIALVAAAVVGVLFFWNNYQIAASGDWNTLATTTGEQQSVELADGTVVWLNENSQLDYPLAFGAERKVILRGEAFFDVAKDVDHPFVIETTGAEIDVLGTSFNVRAYAQEEQVVVAVRSGKVRFQPDRSNQNWTLTAKDKFTFDLAEKKYWQEVDETNNDWSWHSQKLQFKKTKLRQVLADLERHYQLKIELVNPALYDCRNYTGTFNQAKVEDILASLQTVFDLQMEREGNRTFRLIGGQCQ